MTWNVAVVADDKIAMLVVLVMVNACADPYSGRGHPAVAAHLLNVLDLDLPGEVSVQYPDQLTEIELMRYVAIHGQIKVSS